MRPSGKVNLIAVVILGALGYGIWWVVTFSAVYLDNLDVTDAVVGAYNQSGNLSDQAIKQTVIGKTNLSSLGSHDADDGHGTLKTVGGLGLTEENITVVRDEVAKRISIVVEYQRKVLLKPTSRVKWVKFKVKREGPIPH